MSRYVGRRWRRARFMARLQDLANGGFLGLVLCLFSSLTFGWPKSPCDAALERYEAMMGEPAPVIRLGGPIRKDEKTMDEDERLQRTLLELLKTQRIQEGRR